ncbi:SDR family oxidoreductase [Oceanisphaera psychrotolerans]|uniref:Short-chain dehydrogenase n=1 Tax=Oceanisphaera psychrotolerans TaxID=1414654 RepID=A0A1J4QDR6_9GAMM|nr:SDR family oxidoreductase [Oceanisphaera psychrotolerans]OIN07738.1 short-chain dehydrogenase [Oceanisphaera psychrotolerans]
MSKNVLITGCSSGIGHTAAHFLQQQGFRVIASARQVDDVAALTQQGLDAVQLDLADEASIEAAVEQTLALTGGTLYGLFNNGAYGQPGALEDLPTTALREQFNTNLFGTHHLTRLILPVMLKAGEGRIIQNSSVLGLVAMPFRGAYNASKFALEGYTDTLRLELAGSGVHVSLLEPGPIETRFRANAETAFLRHIDAEHSRHRQGYRQTLARLQRPGPSSRYSLEPQACMAPLLHALDSRRPRIRYPVTRPTVMMGWLRRLLSARALDRLLLKAGG